MALKILGQTNHQTTTVVLSSEWCNQQSQLLMVVHHSKASIDCSESDQYSVPMTSKALRYQHLYTFHKGPFDSGLIEVLEGRTSRLNSLEAVKGAL